MKLALHIGTARTGTTTLQVWFEANRAALSVQGIRYPTTPGIKNHRRLMVYALDSSPTEGALTGLGIRTPDDHEEFRSRMRSEMAQEVAKSAEAGEHTWIMSSELLHSRINSPAMVARLAALLRPNFDQITVYLHLRPQVDLLISNATQVAKGGRPVTRADLTRASVGEKSNFYNYDKFVGHWESVFGAQNLRLVSYKTTPDITRFMIDTLGIDPVPLTPVVSVNPGLDWRAIALSNAVHAGFADLGIGLRPFFHLETMPGQDRLQMGRSLSQEVQARFDASNTRLAQRRSDITLEELTPDWAAFDETGNLGIVEGPCAYAPQIAHVIRRLTQDAAMERWRRHIAEGHLAAHVGDAEGLSRAKAAAKAVAAELDALGYVWDTEPAATA